MLKSMAFDAGSAVPATVKVRHIAQANMTACAFQKSDIMRKHKFPLHLRVLSLNLSPDSYFAHRRHRRVRLIEYQL